MSGTDKIRHPKKRAFLAALSETGNVTAAAELCKHRRTLHYEWLQTDPVYAAAAAAAIDEAGDRLETEARRRAVEGVDEPVYYLGGVVGTVRKYSDTLLIFLLKGAKPEKYRETVRVEILRKLEEAKATVVAEIRTLQDAGDLNEDDARAAIAYVDRLYRLGGEK